MTEQFADGRVAVSFIRRDAAEGAPQIVRACILDPGGLEEPGDRAFQLGASGTRAVREDPFVGQPRHGLQQVTSRLSYWAGRASSLRGFQAQTAAGQVDFAPPQPAGFFAAQPGQRYQFQCGRCHQHRGCVRVEHLAEGLQLIGAQHPILCLAARRLDTVDGVGPGHQLPLFGP